MKGRLNSTLWIMVIVDVVALFMVLLLAYSAGAHSGGLGITDFGALGQGAGIKLLFAFVVAAVAGSAGSHGTRRWMRSSAGSGPRSPSTAQSRSCRSATWVPKGSSTA